MFPAQLQPRFAACALGKRAVFPTPEPWLMTEVELARLARSHGHAGEARWTEATAHDVRNAGQTLSRAIRIELSRNSAQRTCFARLRPAMFPAQLQPRFAACALKY